jgi:predicted component of type VI protein secretion system
MRLVIEQGKLAAHGFERDRSEIVIGRGQGCDSVMDEHQVSRQHACLRHTPQDWTLVDLGSMNGTRVSGQPLRAHQSYTQQTEDRVVLDNSVVVLLQSMPDADRSHKRPQKGKPHPAQLAAGRHSIVVVLVGIVVGLVLLPQDREEETAPGVLDPLDQAEKLLPVPILIEGMATALPIPTQSEAFATVMPIPAGLKDIVTALPIEPPQLPVHILATPLPPSAASVPSMALSAGSQGTLP